ncbi:hypothetical protein CYR55_14410 [Chimaeribacter californicus]|uniref:Porin domain-containing protein n=1 Tax=Chimaeribacter californicus TaxID=2060067 RepID=A0A2N5E318_9GAMM|nr:porin [Chimaeribacter californicus]PLR35088.1 hypothetical protein CYR55_14410 [Chimaeribacter californicus]
MFKKNLIAMALPLMLATAGAQATNLYDNEGTKIDFTGSIRLMMENSDSRDQYNPGKDSTQLKDQDSRFGFSFDHAFNQGQAHGIGYLEFGNDTQKGEGDFEMANRQGWAGFRMDGIGDLTFGRVTSPFDDMARSDFTYEYGGAMGFGAYNGGFIGRTSGTGTGEDEFISRVSNTIRIMSADFDGFSFGGTYTMQTETDDGDTGLQNAYTLAAFYNFGTDNLDMYVGAGYGYAHLDENGATLAGQEGVPGYNYTAVSNGSDYDGEDGTEQIWGLAGKLTHKPTNLSFAIDVGQVYMDNVISGDVGYDGNQNADKALFYVGDTATVNLFGLGVKWAYDGDSSIYGGYYLKDADDELYNWKEQKYVIGTDYYFTKNVVVWGEYAYIDTESEKWTDANNVKHDFATVGDDNRIAAGMRIYF